MSTVGHGPHSTAAAASIQFGAFRRRHPALEGFAWTNRAADRRRAAAGSRFRQAGPAARTSPVLATCEAARVSPIKPTTACAPIKLNKQSTENYCIIWTRAPHEPVGIPRCPHGGIRQAGCSALVGAWGWRAPPAALRDHPRRSVGSLPRLPRSNSTCKLGCGRRRGEAEFSPLEDRGAVPRRANVGLDRCRRRHATPSHTHTPSSLSPEALCQRPTSHGVPRSRQARTRDAQSFPRCVIFTGGHGIGPVLGREITTGRGAYGSFSRTASTAPRRMLQLLLLVVLRRLRGRRGRRTFNSSVASSGKQQQQPPACSRLEEEGSLAACSRYCCTPI
jgi:hypothetical protein